MANNLIDKNGKVNTEGLRKKREKQQEAFASIDAAMAILEKMPDLVDVGLDFLNADSFTFATSSGSPPRRIGMSVTNCLSVSSGSALVMSVKIKPGAIALARIPRAPSSLATDFVRAMIPALEAA